MVLGLEFIKGLALVVLDHVADELFSVQVQHAGRGPVSQECVAYGVHQVGLAQTDATVDEKWVVHNTRCPRHMQCGCAGHLVGPAGYQGVKRERAVEFVGSGCRCGWCLTATTCPAGGAACGSTLCAFNGRQRAFHQRACRHRPALLRLRTRQGHAQRGGSAGRPQGHGGFAWSQTQFKLNGLLCHVGQHRLDQARVLIADPVEDEAVGCAQGHMHARTVLSQRDLGRRQGADPCVELLRGQFGRQAFTAQCPEVSRHLVEKSLDERAENNSINDSDRSYPQSDLIRQCPVKATEHGASV